MSNPVIRVSAAIVSLLALMCLPSVLNALAENGGPTDPGPGAANPPGAAWKLGAPVKFEKLTIFPVTASRCQSGDEFITLDEALKSGQVKITEMGADSGSDQNGRSGAQVNQLSVKNDSGKPLFRSYSLDDVGSRRKPGRP